VILYPVLGSRNSVPHPRESKTQVPETSTMTNHKDLLKELYGEYYGEAFNPRIANIREPWGSMSNHHCNDCHVSCIGSISGNGRRDTDRCTRVWLTRGASKICILVCSSSSQAVHRALIFAQHSVWSVGIASLSDKVAMSTSTGARKGRRTWCSRQRGMVGQKRRMNMSLGRG